jgi:hypothetical protein
MHVVLKPDAAGALGHYRFGGVSGTMAATPIAANSEIVQFRWTDATRLAVITRIAISCGLNIAAGGAGLGAFRACIARAFSAAGTGGNTATLTGDNSKMRTSMGTTLLGELRYASTAALGAGTKTLDTNDIAAVGFGIGTGALTVSPSTTILPHTDLVNCTAQGCHPIVLAQNEGLILRTGPAWPATATWHFAFEIDWAEVTAY